MNFNATVKELLIILAGMLFSLLFVFLAHLCTSCSEKSHDTYGTDLQKLESKAGTYYELIGKDKEAVIEARCDGLTFRSLGYYVGIDYPLFKHEYKEKGHWHRDYKPCFSVGASRSEISRDGFIMLFIALFESKNLEALKAIKEYGQKHNWLMGEGPIKYTDIKILTPVLYDMIEKLSLTTAETGEQRNSEDSLLKLDTFRGNLLAMYIWLRFLVNEKITASESFALKQLYSANENNPMYSALYFRFLGEGNQGHTIELLENQDEFPSDRLPGRVELFNWGDAPGSILYLVTVKILKHK